MTLTFAPDHPSDHFSDGVRIELFGKEEQHVFKVCLSSMKIIHANLHSFLFYLSYPKNK